MTLYAWPATTAFGRNIPKNRIYDGADASRALQEKFVAQVERLEWTHVLRPDTLNVPPSPNVDEIAVITVTLHTSEVDPAVLAAIEKAIPRPLILELAHGGRRRLAATWKRPSLAEAGKWVTSAHFLGPWHAETAARQPLPAALDLGALYAALLNPLLPPAQAPDEAIASRIGRAEEAAQIARDIARLEAGLRREKQFNRKVELNAALRAARARHAQLITGKLDTDKRHAQAEDAQPGSDTGPHCQDPRAFP